MTSSRAASLVTTTIVAAYVVTTADSASFKNLPYLRNEDLPVIGNDPEQMKNWISLSKDVEFLEVDSKFAKRPPPSNKEKIRRHLDEGEDDETTTSGKWDTNNPYSVQPFVEGISEYDEYQQAWRMLGFMIDCNPTTAEYENESQHSNSGDATDDECARYVLWAAYVDLYYEGGGIGEYQYYDRHTKSWNDTACYYAEGGGSHDENGDDDGNNGYKSRCAKMDCHLDNTDFSLLGFFKHRSLDDWMEQLFKHEGMCVWTEEEYAFMKAARNTWPQGCMVSGSTTPEGDYIYYDVKPTTEGRITIGLYTDTECVEPFSSDLTDVENLLGNFLANGEASGSNDNGNQYDFSGETLEESMDRWNDAFDVWSYCHPCVAHDLENLDGSKYLYNDDYYYYDNYQYGNRRERKLGGEYEAEGDVFECYDDAGYTNVNQCMKFSAKTTMETATFRDIMLAKVQNTLVEKPLAGYLKTKGNYRGEQGANAWTTIFFILAVSFFVFSIVILGKVYYEAKEAQKEIGSAGDLKDDLLVEKGTQA